MQTVSNGDSLHEISNSVFWENKKNIISLSSAELVQRVVEVIELQLSQVLHEIECIVALYFQVRGTL